MVAATPGQGGATWAVLQYLLGFSQLGHDVYFVEPVRSDQVWPDGTDLAHSENASYCARVMADAGLNDRWALLGETSTAGLDRDRLQAVAGDADVLINLSGTLRHPDLLERASVRVWLDVDPGFNQLWHEVEGIDMGFDGHTHFVTVGPAIGDKACPVPTCGLYWLSTRPPVVLDKWRPVDATAHDGFTTVANWRGYGSVTHKGIRYGQKAHSLRPFMALPTMIPEPFELALAIHPDENGDVTALQTGGWRVIDPEEAAGTPERYRRFVRTSRAEFGVAKSGYVLSRCGWFSDRSACYLASGRPVLAQDTGFATWLPSGEGLLAFSTADDVVAAAEALRGGYDRHARAARELAIEYLDSRRVLTGLLDLVGSP
jgi:hypothetical protein